MTGALNTGDPMRILVVGASGFIGKEVATLFEASGHLVLSTYSSHAVPGLVKLDICDELQTMNIVMSFRPDVVVHAAAISNVDACEVDRDLCHKVNVLGTQHLIDFASAVGAKLVYFSSDYIFDGKSGPYSEDDTPNPVNFYGACKLEAESRIRRQLVDFIIARTTVVYGWEQQGKNFVMQTIARLKRGELTKVAVDQVGTPTYVNNLAEALLDLVGKGQRGVFNVVGPELMDRYTFAKLVAEVFDLPRNLLIPVRTAEIGQKASRPLNAGMKIDKLRMVSTVRMLPPKEGLMEMRDSKERSM